MSENNGNPVVSIILPVYNGELWLDACLKSVIEQTFDSAMELCVFDDSSTDNSRSIIENYAACLKERNVNLILTYDVYENEKLPKGCGYAKNRAVQNSTGDYLCFLDADDVMHPQRIEMQFQHAIASSKNTLLGCQVVRDPPESTVRYTKWINTLSPTQLFTQIYTSHGPTIVMPTWFCHRSVFDSVGGFDEGGKGIPEDYIFFLKHLKIGGNLHKVDQSLLTYRHHSGATTFSVLESTLWNIRLKALEENVLCKWTEFTIWNAGKQGRKFYREICAENRKKVKCFCDVDENKIKKGVYIYEMGTESVKTKVPIVHFTNASKPFIICVKLDLTGGAFECNLNSLKLTEGLDYVLFS